MNDPALVMTDMEHGKGKKTRSKLGRCLSEETVLTEFEASIGNVVWIREERGEGAVSRVRRLGSQVPQIALNLVGYVPIQDTARNSHQDRRSDLSVLLFRKQGQ